MQETSGTSDGISNKLADNNQKIARLTRGVIEPRHGGDERGRGVVVVAADNSIVSPPSLPIGLIKSGI